MGSCYCKRKTKEKLIFCENLVIIILLNSLLYYHNRIDFTPLAAGTPKVDDNPVMLYLGYYY
jgi:hypothetical protein